MVKEKSKLRGREKERWKNFVGFMEDETMRRNNNFIKRQIKLKQDMRKCHTIYFHPHLVGLVVIACETCIMCIVSHSLNGEIIF